jgi:hypothetical protein
MGDNRSGMTGYAELLLNRDTASCSPTRAHGASGGELATYGLLERDDIRRWFEWLELNQSPPCMENRCVVLWEVPKADHCGGISTAHDEFEARLISWFEVPLISPMRSVSEFAEVLCAKARSPKLAAVPFTSTKPHPHPQSPASAESSARLHRRASILMSR